MCLGLVGFDGHVFMYAFSLFCMRVLFCPRLETSQ
jgi:hypothetical protein